MIIKHFGSILVSNLLYKAMGILWFCNYQEFCNELDDADAQLAIVTKSGESPINYKSRGQQKAYYEMINSNLLVLSETNHAMINPRLKERI